MASCCHFSSVDGDLLNLYYGATTLIITTLSLMTLVIMGLFANLSINDTQRKNIRTLH